MGVNDRHHPSCPLPGEHPCPDSADPDGVPVSLDLARADLYRLLDELARSTARSHGDLVRAFERAWEGYKEQTGRRCGLP
jgi:hypothetical protein